MDFRHGIVHKWQLDLLCISVLHLRRIYCWVLMLRVCLDDSGLFIWIWIWLARSVHGNLKWHGTHSNRQVKDLAWSIRWKIIRVEAIRLLYHDPYTGTLQSRGCHLDPFKLAALWRTSSDQFIAKELYKIAVIYRTEPWNWPLKCGRVFDWYLVHYWKGGLKNFKIKIDLKGINQLCGWYRAYTCALVWNKSCISSVA